MVTSAEHICVPGRSKGQTESCTKGVTRSSRGGWKQRQQPANHWLPPQSVCIPPKNQLLVPHREAKANAVEEAKREAAQQVRQGRGFGEFRQCSRGIISVLPMPAALRFASSFARHLPKPLSCQDKRSQVTAVGHQMTPDWQSHAP